MSQIAIIDDDPLIVRYVTVALKQKGYAVEGFEKPGDFLEAFRARTVRPDVILLDLLMPDANGMDVLDLIKKADASVPVIVSTGSESQEDVIEALRRGAEDFIKKPLRDSILLASVRRTLEGAEARRRNEELLRQLKEQNDELALYRREMEGELKLARRVQDWLMRVDFDPMKRFSFQHRHVAASNVTGDFVDVMNWRERQYRGIIFVDIAGHGVSAALLAPVFRFMMRKCLQVNRDPASALKELTRESASLFDDGRYASLLYVLLDDETGTATVAKAGQEPALLLRAGGTALETLNPEGFPIGMNVADLTGLEPEYEEIQVKMEPGDRILLYTDGLVEASPPGRRDEMFGREPLMKLLKETARLPAVTVLDMLFNEVLMHTGTEGFADDSSFAIVEALAPR